MNTSASPDGVRTILAGIGMACLSTSLGGMTVVFTRLIIVDSDPFSLTFARYGVTGLILAAMMYWTMRPPRMEMRDKLIMAVIALFMFAAFPYFMARALEDTTAARGGLLFATMPLITIVVGSLFRVERLTIYKAAGVGVALLGTGIALGERVDAIAPNAIRGDLYMLAGMGCACTFNVFSKRFLMKYGNLPVLVYQMLVGVSALFVLSLFLGEPFSGSLSFDFEGWMVFLMLAIPGGAVMMYSWGKALQLISPTQATIAIGLNPLTAMLLGAWFLAEPLSWRLFGGFMLLVVALVLANFEHLRRRKAPVRP